MPIMTELTPSPSRIITRPTTFGRISLTYRLAYSFISSSPKEESTCLLAKMTMPSIRSITAEIISKKSHISIQIGPCLTVGLDRHFTMQNSMSWLLDVS